MTVAFTLEPGRLEPDHETVTNYSAELFEEFQGQVIQFCDL